MQQWLIKLQSDCFPGQFVILSLLSLAIVFLINERSFFNQVLFLLTFIILISLLVIKKIRYVWLILPLFIIFLGFLNEFKVAHFPSPKIGDAITIGIDELKIKDDFAFGEATLGNQTILVSFSDQEQVKKLRGQKRDFTIKIQKFEEIPIKFATNKSEFDLKSYFRHRQITKQIQIEQFDLISINHLITIGEIRFKIKNYLEKLPSNLKFFSTQLILGSQSDHRLDEVTTGFKKLGIVHLLCLSGLHVTIYIEILSLICNFLKISTRPRVVLISIFLFFMVFLTKFQAGLMRATLTYFLANILSYKKIKLAELDKFGLVLLIHQLIFPNLMLNVGAQLSYLLVFGLKIIPTKDEILQSVWLNILIFPLLVRNFFELNLLTVVYNLFAIPIFNIIILPATFIGIIGSFVSKSLMLICDKILQIVNELVVKTASTNIGNFVFGKISIAMTIMLIFLIIKIIIKPNFRTKMILIGTILTLIFSKKFPLLGQVTFIDVGQGDSILVTSPFNRQVALIDTGGKLSFGHKTTGKTNVEKVTVPYLKSQGICHIDAVFLSHQDADHIGDLIDLTQKFPVNQIVYGAGMEQNSSFKAKMKQIKNVQFVPVLGPQGFNLGSVKLNVLAPTKKGLGTNEDSMCIQLEMMQKKWLLTGDLDQNGELNLIKNNPNLTTNYLKLGHHGSKTSSAAKFLKKLTPQMAIISSGRDNRYGHPHQETLKLLQKFAIPEINTAQYGMINWYFGPFGYEKFEEFLGKNDIN